MICSQGSKEGIFEIFHNSFIWSIYTSTKILKIFMETLTIVLELPMILV